MKPNKKKQFIDITYDLLKKEGISGISIRRVASEVGCTSTVIYNHFENLEHLITVSAVRYLEDYLKEFKKITAEMLDPIEHNLRLWEAFAYYALHNVDIFEMLFFGKYSENLVELIYEYYELYSESYIGMDGLVVSVCFNGNLHDRDYIMYRRAASMGYLDSKHAEMLSDMEVYMFHGILMQYKGKILSEEEIQKILDQFIKTLRTIVDKFRLK